MLFTFTDLEPRKKAEEALRKSEERFAKAFRMAPVPSLVLYGDDLQALDINQAFSETFGYQAEELLGESTVACGLWQDGGAERLGELLAQSGSVRNVQLRLQHKDRNGLDCLVSAEAVSLNEQDCVLVALLDISDRRRTEMELVHAIETVMQDASWFSRTLIEKLANVRRANAPGTGAELADLTARERGCSTSSARAWRTRRSPRNWAWRRTPCATTWRPSTPSSMSTAVARPSSGHANADSRRSRATATGANKRRGYECTRAAGAFVPIARSRRRRHWRSTPGMPRPWSCTFSPRREPRCPHVCSLASFALAGASRLLSNICPSASAGARRHPAGRLRMLGTGFVKF